MSFDKIFKRIEKWKSFNILIYSVIFYFIITSIMLGFIKPDGFEKFFLLEKSFNDIDIYISLAKNGYNSISDFAMYPLWPLIIKGIATVLSTSNYMRVANFSAFFIFCLSLPFFWLCLKKSFDKSTALLLYLCFVFNPLSIFHSIGYTESLATLEFSLWLYFIKKILNENIDKKNSIYFNSNYFIICLVSFALGLTRPIFAPFLISTLVTLFLIWKFEKNYIKSMTVLIYTLLSMFLGYLIYALFSLWKGYGLLASYRAQNSWDRVLGLHWDVIFSPISVGGSDNVLNWDLQAFWFPLIFLLIALIFTIKKKSLFALEYDTGSVKKVDIIFWLALLFSCAHSAIQFLSYDRFFSTSRFIFAIPLFYYVIGRILEIFSKKVRLVILLIYFVYSLGFFIYWWTRYARGAWIG
ncbi:hypothetical protein [Fluviispira vulneris]|uniref:hypothetical protein n=1 Tax=Fluviispira vulneris TaxID=2763012 RepID=UPI0016460B64|nr:hypothetical protein [Fluviispira vulneris]